MKRWLVIFVLTLLLLPAVKDLFKPAAYTSHDLTHHIVRTIHMDRILRQGQFPPRWVDQLNYGYGYPLFLFNYPLPSMLAVGVHALGADYIWSVKIVMAVSMVLSGLAAFLWCAYLFRSRLAGIVGGLLYVYAPIRFVNVYVSATFGNAVAFAFVPLVFWAILKAYRGEFDRKALLGGAISLAGLVTSHNIMALMFLPVVAGFTLFLLILRPVKTYRRFAALTLGLGLGLSSFFLLPASIERRLIRYDETLVNFYKSHFPTVGQLFHSPWGYGFSHPGTAEDDMSFQIGLAQLLVVVLVLGVLFLYSRVGGKLKTWVSGMVGNRFLRKTLSPFAVSIALFFLAVFGVSIFLMLEVSLPIWERVPFLPYVQMPWRFLAVTTFAAATLSGLVVTIFKPRWLIAGLLGVAVLVANRNHLRINQVFDPGEGYYLGINNATTMASEHLPKGADKFDNFPQSTSKLEVLSGDAEILIDTNTAARMTAHILAKNEATVRFNQVAFAGWRYTLDGKELKVEYELSRPLPHFSVSPGAYEFEALFGRTKTRQVADIISLVSLVSLGVLALTPKATDDFKQT